MDLATPGPAAGQVGAVAPRTQRATLLEQQVR